MCDAVGNALAAGTISRRSLLKAGAAGAALMAASPVIGDAQARDPQADARRHRTRLILLGTAGGPPWWEGGKRYGISSAVAVGDEYYIVDAGDGIGHRLQESGLGNAPSTEPLDTLRAIFLTHLHSDHVVDLNSLLTVGMLNGLAGSKTGAPAVTRKVQIWGPGNRGALPPLFGPPPAPPVVAPENPTPGTSEMVALLVRAFATDYNDRARDNRRPVPDQLFSAHDVPVPAQYTDDPNGDPAPRMSPVRFYEDDRVRISATLVQHAPMFPALGFRFDTDDGSIVFSGDTGPTPNLVELAQGADILVHEVIAQQWVEQLLPAPRTPAQEGLFQHLLISHTTIEQVGPIAEEAGVRKLVLNHIIPGDWPARVFRRAQRGFSGRLIVGQDLDQVGVGRARRP